MNDTIGQRIASLRKEQGLSQEALGEKMGVSRQAVNKWESDAAIAEIDKLIALSRLFGVSIGWLLGVEEEAPQKEDPALVRIEELLKSQPKQPKWQKPLLIATALCAVLSLGLSLYTMNRKSPREDQLEDLLFAAVNSMDVGQGELVVEQILTSSIVKDASIRVSPWKDFDGATLTFAVIPDGYVPGQTAQIQIFAGQKHQLTVDCTYDQGFWEAKASLAALRNYSYRFLLTYPNGTEQSQTLSAGVLSDLKGQLEYRLQGSYGKVSTRPGYFTIHSLTLNAWLPPVLEGITPIPQWEQLDLVFYQNGEELFRKDYLSQCPSGDFFYSSPGGISTPIESLNPADSITVHIQAKAANCPQADQMIFGWEILEDGSVQEIFSLENGS